MLKQQKQLQLKQNNQKHPGEEIKEGLEISGEGVAGEEVLAGGEEEEEDEAICHLEEIVHQ